MNASTRPTRELQEVWSPELRIKLLEARVESSRGRNAPDWPMVSSSVSMAAGTRLSTEECRKKAKLLVKQLSKHGLPPKSSFLDQLQYAKSHPEALETAKDRSRSKLLEWAQQRGITMKPAAAVVVAKQPMEPSDQGQALAKLLQQTRYLKILEDSVEESECIGDENEVGQAGGRLEVERDGSDESPLQVLGEFDEQKFKVAAALRRYLLSVDSGGVVRDESVQAEPSRCIGMGYVGDATNALQHASVHTGTGGYASHVEHEAEDAVPVAVARESSGDQQTNAETFAAGLDAGMLADGRWLANVQVSRQARRVRIQKLRSQGRLKVGLKMGAWLHALRVKEQEQLMKKTDRRKRGKKAVKPKIVDDEVLSDVTEDATKEDQDLHSNQVHA